VSIVETVIVEMYVVVCGLLGVALAHNRAVSGTSLNLLLSESGGTDACMTLELVSLLVALAD